MGAMNSIGESWWSRACRSKAGMQQQDVETTLQRVMGLHQEEGNAPFILLRLDMSHQTMRHGLAQLTRRQQSDRGDRDDEEQEAIRRNIYTRTWMNATGSDLRCCSNVNNLYATELERLCRVITVVLVL